MVVIDYYIFNCIYIVNAMYLGDSADGKAYDENCEKSEDLNMLIISYFF